MEVVLTKLKNLLVTREEVHSTPVLGIEFKCFAFSRSGRDFDPSSPSPKRQQQCALQETTTKKINHDCLRIASITMDPKPPAPKKRSLFTQAALSKKIRAVDPEGLIFNRAKELEAERLAEDERKRQKRILKLEQKRSTQSAERKEDTVTPPKRRKISAPVEDRDGNNSESSSGPEEPEEPTWARRYVESILYVFVTCLISF